MKKLLFMAAAALCLSAVTSCDDNISSIGSSIVEDQVEIMVDSTFVITGHSVPNTEVQARTVLQLLGSITAGSYGTFESSVVTQFMPTQNFITEGVTDQTIDSVKLIMRVPLGAYVGDSMAVMGLTAYPLTQPLPANITSSFNPKDYFDPSQPMGSTMYTVNGGALNDSLASFPYRIVSMHLGKELGQKLLNRYKDSPSTFSSPTAFAQWFPGLYLRNTFGSGRVVQVDSTVISMYYRQILPVDDAKNPRDTTIYRTSSYLAVTPEILTNNNMTYAMAPELIDRAQAGEPIIIAPIGYDVQLNFPAQALVDRIHSTGSDFTVLNSLSLSIPVEEIANDHGITPPPYVLLVKKSMKEEFFRKSLLPDNVNSFYAAYDSYKRSYTFNDMRGYILDVLEKNTVTTDDEEFIICPVTISFEQKASASNSMLYYYYYGAALNDEQSYIVAGVTPYVNRPAMAKLSLDKSKIVFTYSVQQIKF